MGIDAFAGRRVDDVKASVSNLRAAPASSLVGNIPVEMLKIGGRTVSDIIGSTTKAVFGVLGTTTRIAAKAALASIPVPVAGGRNGETVSALWALRSLHPRNIESRLEQPGGIVGIIRERRAAAAAVLKGPPPSQAGTGPVVSLPDGTDRVSGDGRTRV